MELQFLGTGSGLSLTLGNNNALINKTVLIDCGFTAPERLLRLDCLKTIEDIIITHLHGDHCHGLEILGFLNMFAINRRPRIHLTRSMADSLWNEVLKGTMMKLTGENNSPRNACFDEFFEICHPEDSDMRISAGGIELVLQPSPHVPGKESYSVRIHENGKKRAFYTSDVCLPVTSIIVDADSYETIFHDVQLFESGNDVHVSLKTLTSLPDALKKKIILMHYSEAIAQQDTSSFAGVATTDKIYSW